MQLDKTLLLQNTSDIMERSTCETDFFSSVVVIIFSQLPIVVESGQIVKKKFLAKECKK